MFQDTQPAELDTSSGEDCWASFRISHPQELVAMLRQLRDGQVPVTLNGPDGATMTSILWAVDEQQSRLNFTVDPGIPAVGRLVEADEAVAVAYMDSVKLQFDLHQIVAVHGAHATTLQSALPESIYRFQRRNAYRLRSGERNAPTARLRHPSIPDMQLGLRVLDLSIGGCALWLPRDLPTLQAGTRIADVVVELDIETRFAATLQLQHVTALGVNDHGVRLGCEWQQLSGQAQRVLQRWIDHSQKRRRLLALE